LSGGRIWGLGVGVLGSEKGNYLMGVLRFFSMYGENIFQVELAGSKGLGNKGLGCLFFRHFCA